MVDGLVICVFLIAQHQSKCGLHGTLSCVQIHVIVLMLYM